MPVISSNERLMRILTAAPEQLAAIDRVLDGTAAPAQPERRGPLLLKMGDAAALLGVSRPTLWRMLNAGRLARVEILPETFRVRREEVEAVAYGPCRTGHDGEHPTSNIQRPTANKNENQDRE